MKNNQYFHTNMSKLLLVSFLSLASVLSSEAALTINVSTNPSTGPYFVLSNGSTRNSDGNLVRIGSFAAAPAAGSTFEALNAAFTEFATTTTGHSAASGANKGMINRSGIVDAPGGAAETSFQAKQVYIWVYNAPTAAAATEMGVFSSAAWLFPDNPDAVPNSLSTTVITQAFGVGATAAAVNVGSPNTFQLASVVPEPSAALLGGFSALLLLRRRRA